MEFSFPVDSQSCIRAREEDCSCGFSFHRKKDGKFFPETSGAVIAKWKRGGNVRA